MIIKSMARKSPSFAQLIAYIGRGVGAEGECEFPHPGDVHDADPATGAAFARNLYHSGLDEAVVAGQFLDNWRLLPERANGNALYHEVIVLERQPHLDRARLNAALLDIADRYCALRAGGQLAWGRVHHDTDHPHIHLMLSANAVRSRRRARLDRARFARVQREVERYAARAHPELAITPVYDRRRAKETPKITRDEGERRRRTGAPSQKEEVFAVLAPLFGAARDRAELEAALEGAGFRLYQRGRTFGVEDRTSGKRYRLRTLGLEAAFERACARETSPSRPQPAPVADGPEHTPSRDGARVEPSEDRLADRLSSEAPVRSERQTARSEPPAQPAKAPEISGKAGPESGEAAPPAPYQTDRDDRAAALLAERAAMEEAARARLEGFEPGGPGEGADRDERSGRDEEEGR